MPNHCTLSEQQRTELEALLNQYAQAQRAVSDKLGEIADRWDDQLLTHVGDTEAEDRLDRLIKWREQFSREELAIPEGL